MSTFIETLGDHTYTLELPSWLALAPLPALVAVVLVLVAAVRRPWVGVSVPVLVGAGVLLSRALAASATKVPTLGTLFSRADAWLAAGLAASMMAVLGCVIGGIAALVDRRPVLGGASAVIALVGVLTGVAVSSVRSTWEARWNLPALLVPSIEGHVGRAIEVTPKWATQAVRSCALLVFCNWGRGPSTEVPAPSGCEAEPTTVRLERGATRAQVEGRCKLGSMRLSLRRSFEAHGVEERGTAAFPLRVGNEWRYRLVSHSRSGTVLFVFGGDSRTARSPVLLTLRVAREVELGNYRGFELEVSRKDQTTKAVVVAADGSLWTLVDGERRPAIVQPTVEHGGSLVLAGFVDEWERGGDGLLPGPRRWLESSRDDAGGILLAVLTVGLVLPPSSATWWELAETVEGDGVEVPNAPLPPPLPPREKAFVRVLPAPARATGALTSEQVEEVLLSQGVGLERCVRDAQPGAIELALEITATGKVSAPQVSAGASVTERECVKKWLRGLAFPRGGGKTQVTQLVRLRWPSVRLGGSRRDERVRSSK